MIRPPHCHKIGYPTKRIAERAVDSIRRRENDKGIHAYRCPNCIYWHLGHGGPPPLPDYERAVLGLRDAYAEVSGFGDEEDESA